MYSFKLDLLLQSNWFFNRHECVYTDKNIGCYNRVYDIVVMFSKDSI